MNYESNQDFSTTTAKYWQDDAIFWALCGDRPRAARGEQKASQHLHVVINHRPHQSEY